jgi:predicted DNA-binding protein
MELEKKTTILFPKSLHRDLTRLAKERGVSLGYLVRTACELQYNLSSTEARLEAVEELRGLSLPVGSVEEMKRESVPDPDDLLP